MLKSFIGADMRLYERFGIGLHNNPDSQELELIKLRKINGLRHFSGLEVTQESHKFQTL